MLPGDFNQKVAMPEDPDEMTEPDDEVELDEEDPGDEDLDDEDLVDEVDLGDDDLVDVVEDEDDDDAVVPAVVRPGEGEEDDDDEDLGDEDVEASLDVILKERLVVEDEPEDDEAVEVDDRSETTERVLPKQPDEFVCRSCFLVKHPSQLADRKKMLCRDCV